MQIYKMDGHKDGRQQYRVRVNYVDNNGKYKQIDRVAYGLAEAKDLERKLSQDINDPVSGDTILDLVDAYLTAKKQDNRLTTYEKTKRNLSLYVIPDLGSVKLRKLTPEILETWRHLRKTKHRIEI